MHPVKPLSLLLPSILSAALLAGCGDGSEGPEPPAWHPLRTGLPFARKIGPSLVATGEDLWLLGGTGNEGYNREIWARHLDDPWALVSDSLPFQEDPAELQAVAWRDSILAVKLGAHGDDPSGETRFYPELWISGDGRAWRRIGTVPFAPLREVKIVSTGNTVWFLAGYGEDGKTARWFGSEDGNSWAFFSATSGEDAPRGSLLACPWQGKVYALDSAKNGWVLANSGAWTRVMDGPPEKLSTSDRSLNLASLGSRLFFFGGHVDIRGKYREGTNQVWTSRDGKNWEALDSRSPFGYRIQPGIASHQGRLWVVGGSASEAGSEWDAWSLAFP